MSDYKFVEFAGKKEYKCPKCKGPIRYAKYFGSDGKLLTTDGKEAFGGMVDGKYKSNTGWPTNEMTKMMHECESECVAPMAKESKIIDKSQLETFPEKVARARELTIDDMAMGNRKGEILTECALLWKEEVWITDYLLKKGGANPNPAKVGMWHKMVRESLVRQHEPD